MKKSYFLFPVLVLLFSAQSCTDHNMEPTPEPQLLTSEPLFSELKLKSPIGIAVDDKGNIWVTEAGTGSNNTDGSVSMITPSGNKTTFVTGLLSVTNAAEGSIEGISHLFYRDGNLYFLHGVSGMLYKADVSSFKEGDSAVSLASIPSEDVGTYIRSLALTNPLNSNAFDLTLGPGGHLYIVDSGSNAIIKKDKDSGKLSLFAHFPDAATKVDAVPTGIVYDGSNLLISSLTGFPFTPGSAKIFTVDKDGTVGVYKDKYTTLTGITLSANGKPIVIQHGEFGPMGFADNSGKVLDGNGNILLSGITRPTGIVRAGDKLFYLISYTDGTISKLTY